MYKKDAFFQKLILTLRENKQHKSNFRHPFQFSTPDVEFLIEKISPKNMILEWWYGLIAEFIGWWYGKINMHHCVIQIIFYGNPMK